MVPTIHWEKHQLKNHYPVIIFESLEMKVFWDMGLLLYSVRIRSHFTVLSIDVLSPNR